MSRTYKGFPRWQHRSPRGRRRAIINGARKGAIPPDPWEDIQHDPHCWQPYNVARRMAKEGWPRERIVERLVKKWHLSRSKAIDATFMHELYYPESDLCAVIYRERK